MVKSKGKKGRARKGGSTGGFPSPLSTPAVWAAVGVVVLAVALWLATTSDTFSTRSSRSSVPPSTQSGGDSDGDGDGGSSASQRQIQKVLDTHARVDETRRHTSQVSPRASLAYVTPWNNKGYDIAKEFNGKFTHISPVWFQLHKEAASGKFVVAGQHDVDQGWLADVRRPAPGTGRVAKIVPRVIVEGLGLQDMTDLLGRSKARQQEMAAVLLELCRKHGLDGIVLELWSRVQMTPEVRPAMTQLIAFLGDQLRRADKELILVVPPVAASFGPGDFRNLAPVVSYFSINTYDYSAGSTAGPNAPYKWVKSCLETLLSATEAGRAQPGQLLMGLNFYGNSFTPAGAQPMLGHEYVRLLSEAKDHLRLTWNKQAREHVLRSRSADTAAAVYYPSDRSIRERVQLANDLGVGICIWDVGQGLDSFFNQV